MIEALAIRLENKPDTLHLRVRMTRNRLPLRKTRFKCYRT